MKETNTLIIGASFSGLASAASLHQFGVGYLIIEKGDKVVTPWHNHYERLHLHTNKALSHMPYKEFDKSMPRYPTRLQVIEYADSYRKHFNINPIFNTEGISIKKENNTWITTTNNETFKSKNLIIATGPYGKVRDLNFKGMETFPGKILHSADYKTGSDYKGMRVLVVGFGNSATEIGIDLFEQGAQPTMAVRSSVNIIPREFLGIPILRIALIMSQLPPAVADAINNPLMRILFGDIAKLGLKRMPYGTFQQIRKHRTIPVIDIGTINHIKKGHIKIREGIDHIEGSTIHFTDGAKEKFDAIVAAIGYDPGFMNIAGIDQKRLDDLTNDVNHQKHFGEDGLYFCGFWIGPRGALREIALDAKKIAKDISIKYR